MKTQLDGHAEFGFCQVMTSRRKPLAPRDAFLQHIQRLCRDGHTKREIAGMMGVSVPVRTVEGWVQGRRLPADWVCQLLLERL